MQSAHVNTARKKMHFAVRVPFVFLCFLVAGIPGQDVQPEVPVDFPPPTTQEAIPEKPLTTSTTATPEVSTTIPTTIIPTEEPLTTSTPAETEVSTTIPTTIIPTEETTIIPTEAPTIPPTETSRPTTSSTTELTTSSTTELTTSSTTELTTSSTTQPTTNSPTTTQKDPIYPTYKPPTIPSFVQPTTTRRPIYTTKNPWSWNEPAERCYLKEQQQYVTTCWGFGWTTAYTCYRCCYYGNSNFAGCTKLHQGRCWWFD